MADHKKTVKIIKSRYLQSSNADNTRPTAQKPSLESKSLSTDDSLHVARDLRLKYNYITNKLLLKSKDQEHGKELSILWDELLEKVDEREDYNRLLEEQKMMKEKIELLKARLQLLSPHYEYAQVFEKSYKAKMSELEHQANFIILRDISLPDNSLLC